MRFMRDGDDTRPWRTKPQDRSIRPEGHIHVPATVGKREHEALQRADGREADGLEQRPRLRVRIPVEKVDLALRP